MHKDGAFLQGGIIPLLSKRDWRLNKKCCVTFLATTVAFVLVAVSIGCYFYASRSLPTEQVHYVILESTDAPDTSAMKINTNDPCIKSKSYHCTQSYLPTGFILKKTKDITKGHHCCKYSKQNV